MEEILTYANTNGAAFRQQLHDFLRIPSVSTDPERKADVQATAEWLANNMQDAGLENIEIMPTDGHPVVYADWLHAGSDAPTLLVYGHYDVQPATKSDGWHTEPFEPTERDGKLYARGASDDKGQVFIHVKAVESILAAEGHLPINVKFIVEGEEEIGSPNLPSFIAGHADKLSADVCVISDSGILSEEQPSIVYSLRGLVAMDLVITGPAQDLHSGMYGGMIHNPVQALAEIIAKLHKEDGSVAVPGFYDDVLELDQEERAELRKTEPDSATLLAATGAPQLWGEPDFTPRERVGARPTLEINGVAGGFYGEGVKTVLPARAIGKITCRLVANQQPQRIYELIRDYVAKITPPTVKSTVIKQAGAGNPAFIDLNNPAIQAAITAYEKGWGNTPVFMREGGTLPIIADLQKILDLPVVLMGFGLDTDGAHGPNEHFTMSMFHRGIDTSVYFYYQIAERL